jgi:hypothetical protein
MRGPSRSCDDEQHGVVYYVFHTTDHVGCQFRVAARSGVAQLSTSRGLGDFWGPRP